MFNGMQQMSHDHGMLFTVFADTYTVVVGEVLKKQFFCPWFLFFDTSFEILMTGHAEYFDNNTEITRNLIKANKTHKQIPALLTIENRMELINFYDKLSTFLLVLGAQSTDTSTPKPDMRKIEGTLLKSAIIQTDRCLQEKRVLKYRNFSLAFTCR